MNIGEPKQLKIVENHMYGQEIADYAPRPTIG